MLFLGVVAILRQAEGGASSGYSPLVLVPLSWVALYGDERQVRTVSAGLVLVFLLPVLLIGDPQYPTSEWRRLTIWTIVAPIMGITVNHLVTTVAETNQRLEALARTDALTGAANRRVWDERVEIEVARAQRAGHPLAVALLDLDHFKRFNDTHGHQVGDELLAGAVEAWTNELRGTDVLARWGGEEFAVLLPDTSGDDAAQLLERLRSRTPMGQTASVGVAVWEPGEGFSKTISRADAHLYEAKRAGRDQLMGPELGGV